MNDKSNTTALVSERERAKKKLKEKSKNQKTLKAGVRHKNYKKFSVQLLSDANDGHVIIYFNRQSRYYCKQMVVSNGLTGE
jgi:hypothetical protein